MKTKTASSFDPFVRYLLILLSTTFLLQFLFRLVLFLLNLNLVKQEPAALILESFVNGMKYDAVILAYIFTLPTLFYLVWIWTNLNRKTLYLVFKIWTMIFGTVTLVMLTTDIPYFRYYNSRLNKGILSWMETPTLAMKGITGGWEFPLLILFGILSIVLWALLCHRITQKHLHTELHSTPRKYSIVRNSAATLILLTLSFFGMRGQVNFHYMPIGIKNAYFCDNSFLNQMGLNPAFSFIESFQDNELNLISLKEGYELAYKELGIQPNTTQSIQRTVLTKEEVSPKRNVVLILMESMTSSQMGAYGNPKKLTPFLDELTSKSLFFPNTYAAGEHTFNGIFSTLYSFPALLGKNPMINVATSNQKFTGLPVTLKQKGYSTMFLCTNNKDFDNMGGFLSNNGFDRIVSEVDYPKDKITNGWGISDHYLFEVGIDSLNRLAKRNQPFFATFMTISTHLPYTIPKGISTEKWSKNEVDRAYQYADWSLAQFFKMAKQQPWFSNTVFVLIADHGINNDKTYDLPLSYHHIPLIIYAPELITPQTNPDFALQMDVFPTVMGLLNYQYTNKTLGINLLKDKPRPYAFFSSEKMIGVVDSSHYYIWRKGANESLHAYKSNSTENILNANKPKTEVMKKYAFSWMQVTDHLFAKQKTGY